MPYILVDNFSQGLDTRKFAVTSPPGTLLELTNAILDRGAQIEQRKKFQCLDNYSYIDDANRADENPLSNGGAWETGVVGTGGLNDFKLASNRLIASSVISGSRISSSYKAFDSNQGVRVICPVTGVTGMGICVRIQSKTNFNCYMGFILGASGLRIYKVTDAAGVRTLTSLGDIVFASGEAPASSSLVGGDVIEIRVTGAVTPIITMYYNGYKCGSITDPSAPINGGQPGMYSTSAFGTFAGFSAFNLAPDVNQNSNFVSIKSVGNTLFGITSGISGSIADGAIRAKRHLHPSDELGTDWIGGVVGTGNKLLTTVNQAVVWGSHLVDLMTFADGNTWPYYDGKIIGDWFFGYTYSGMTDDNVISLLVTQINQQTSQWGYTASYVSATNTITLTGPSGKSFAALLEKNASPFTTASAWVSMVAKTAQDASTTAVPAVMAVQAVYSTCQFQIIGGTNDDTGGDYNISGVFIGSSGTNLLNGGTVISWATSNAATAASVAVSIELNKATSGWGATSTGSTVNLYATVASPALNSLPVKITISRGMSVCTGGFRVVGGSAGNITSVLVNGAEQLNAVVAWTTTNINTAKLISESINTKLATKYDCVATYLDDYVQIGLKTSTNQSPSAWSLDVVVTGDVALADVTALQTTITTPSGGMAAVTGVSQVMTLSFADPFFTTGTVVRLKVTQTGSTEGIIFGFERVTGIVPSVIGVHKTRVVIGSGSILYGSAVGFADRWNSDDTGSFLIDMSQEAPSVNITGLGVYQGRLAVFSRITILIWYIDSDPSLNAISQIMEGTGTIAASSVVSFGDMDLYYLADSGVRSIRARDASNAGIMNDLGTPIDDTIVAKIATMEAAESLSWNRASAIIDPESGRYWLALGDAIYVFSYFPSGKVAGWSKIEQSGPFGSGSIGNGFKFTDYKLDVFQNKIVMFCTTASGPTVKNILFYGFYSSTTKVKNDYFYGTTNSLEADYLYSLSTATLPFLNAEKPANTKEFTGFDGVSFRSWSVSGAFDTSAQTAYESIGTINGVSYDTGDDAMTAHGTHCSLKLTYANTDITVPAVAGPAKIGAVSIHYKLGDAA